MRQWKNLRQTDSISLIRTIASLTAQNVADTSKKVQYRRDAQQKKLTFMDGTSFANIRGKEKQAYDKTHNPFFFFLQPCCIVCWSYLYMQSLCYFFIFQGSMLYSLYIHHIKVLVLILSLTLQFNCRLVGLSRYS